MGSNVARILGDKPKGRPPSLFNLRNPGVAYAYAESAKERGEGPWPECEEVIAPDPYFSILYAEHILGGPFPEGEAAIAQYSTYSVQYASLCKAPFPKGERRILRNRHRPAVINSVRLDYEALLRQLGYDPDEYWAERIASGELTVEEVYGQ
jgi:hypothetical protein